MAIVDPFATAPTPALKRNSAVQAFDAAAASPAAAPTLKRTWGEASSDVGRAVMSGAAGLVKTGGELTGLVTGDMDNMATRLADSAQEYWQAGQSPGLKQAQLERKAAIDASDSTLGKVGQAIYQTLKRPSLIADTAAENIMTMLPAGAAGRGGKVLASALGAGEKAAAKVGLGAAVSAAGVQQGADVSQSAYDSAIANTDWNANPEFQERTAAGEAPAQIQHDIALRAARLTFPGATAVSLASQALPGGATLERALVGGAARTALTRSGVANKVLAAAKGALGEGTQEAVEEGGGQFAGNLVRQQTVDPNTDLSQDVGENAGIGFVGGALLGAPAGLAHGDAHAPALKRAAPEPFPDAAPGTLSDVANVLHRHSAPDFVADMRGNVADAREKQANAKEAHAGSSANAKPVENASIPAGEQGAVPVDGDREAQLLQSDYVPSPPNVPWFNPETSELRAPTPDEVKDQFHRMFKQASDEGLGMGVTAASRSLAEDWGVPRGRLIELRKEAMAERKEGINPENRAAMTAQAPEATSEATSAAPAETPAAEVPASTDTPAPVRAEPEQAVAHADVGDAAAASDTATVADGLTNADTQPSSVPEQPKAEAGSADTGTAGAGAGPVGEVAPGDAGAAAGGAEATPAAAAEAPAKEGAASGAAEPIAQPSYDDSSEQLDSDVMTQSGTPFTIRNAADVAAKRHEGGKVFAVDGGYVVRTPKEISNATGTNQSEGSEKPAVDTAQPGPATEPGVLPAGRAVDSGVVPAAEKPAIDNAKAEVRTEPAVTAETPVAGAFDEKAATDRIALRQRIVAGDRIEKADVHALLGDKPLGRKEALEALRELKSDQTITADYLADIPSTKVGKAQKFDPVDVARAARVTPEKPSVEAAALESAAHPENDIPEPSPAQHAANNFKQGHVDLHGLDVTIQVPKGGMRRGTDAKGKPWERAASDHYGQIRGTTAADGEPHDVYLGPRAEDPNAKVFVIRQVKPGTDTFDESKAMIGYASGKDARRSYDANFPKGLKVFGGIEQLSIDEFKNRLKQPAEAANARPTEQPRVANVRSVGAPAAAGADVQGEAGKQNAPVAPLPKQEKGERRTKKQLAQAAHELIASKAAEQESTGQYDLSDHDFFPTPHDAQHYAAVDKAVKAVMAEWGENAPAVHVIPSVEELPASAKSSKAYDYRRAAGYHNGNSVWIVADKHATPRAALIALAHEVIGHHGIDNIINEHVKGGWDSMTKDVERLRNDRTLGSPALRSVLDTVESKYQKRDGKPAEPTRFAKEFIAVAAERGLRNGLVARAIAAVKQWLRKTFPKTWASMKFSEADILHMIAASAKYIRSGEPATSRAAQMAAMSFDLAPNTDTPAFKRFFDGSKVVDAKGQPQVVYHGTGEEFTEFKSQFAGAATEHSTTPLGHFFTTSKQLAQRYAEKAADGRPADERVVSGYLAIKNPYDMSVDQAHDIDDPADARALRAKLEREGYDGIRIKEAGTWIAFESGQVKSTENRGTFDRSNPDINFSLDDKVEPFQRPAASMDALDEIAQDPDAEAYDSIKSKIGGKVSGKIEDLTPKALDLIQTTHLVELAREHPALKAVNQYEEARQQMSADRESLKVGAPDAAEHPENMLKRGAATIADFLHKLTFQKGIGGMLGRRNPEAQRMFDFMTDATIAGVDPTKAYEDEKMVNGRGELVPWTPQTAKDEIAAIRGQIRGRSGDDKRPMLDKIKSISPSRYKARQARRRAAYAELAPIYMSLSDAHKEGIHQVREWYSQMSEATKEARVDRIKGLTLDGKYQRQLIEVINQAFAEQRKNPFYVPLNRDGNHFIAYTDAKGEQGYEMFESAGDAERRERDLRKSGAKIYAQGLRDENARAKDAPTGTFVGTVISVLRKAGAPEKVQDQIYQEYLRTMPELSMMKHNIHRKNTAGYSTDGLRTFAKNALHGAHQLAKLRYGPKMEAALEAMTASMNNFRKADNPGESSDTTHREVSRGDMYLANLKKRHEFIMSPKETQLANVANAIGFTYFIGMSPASALVNMTQLAQVTLPVLGATHGWGRASKALSAAFYQAAKSGGNMLRTLTNPEEQTAHRVLDSMGVFQKTRAHDLAGQAEGSLVTTNPVWSGAMKAISYLFHKTEVINREATGIAAFRLARAGSKDEPAMSFENAIKYARDITNGTHMDYSAENRPPIMQGNTARIITQFKNYSVGMTWILYRNLYKAFADQTPKHIRAKVAAGRTLTPTETAQVEDAKRARSIARKTLTGIMGTTALLAGTMGLPIITAVKLAAQAAHFAFGDDDEPWDFDTAYRSWLDENLGETAGKTIADGVVNRLGANVGSRVSLSNLWLRDADRELEGTDAYHAWLETIAGPMGGLIKNLFVGQKYINDGHVQRGVETMLPKFAKDAVKALRFEHEGVNTLNGDPILPDISGPEEFMQLLGFQPTRLFEQQKQNSALIGAQQDITDRRTSLMNAYAMAKRSDGDLDEVLTRIHSFNARYPEYPIDAQTLRRSLAQRARRTAEQAGGITLNKRLAGRVREITGIQPGA